MKSLFPVLFLPAIASAIPHVRRQSAVPTVTLSQGTIIGIATTVASTASPVQVNKFLGVPFAQSPPTRFEPPVAVAPSNTTLTAQLWRPKCIETVRLPPLTDNLAESEDCLYLNIYAPVDATNAAVMFWIYGGNLQFGNAGQPIYDGGSFAANQGVVVVAANYRSNIFGFSNAPDLPLTSRNAGFLDQRLALQWVQENIARFGGDPDKVTIFGESSGGSSVDRLLTAPPAGKLPYRAAILQSGQASLSALPSSPGATSWERVVAAVGCQGTDELSCMQTVDVSRIKSAVMSSGMQFTPQNDGVTQKSTPLVHDRSIGKAANVPMLIGTTGNEGALFIAPVFRSISVTNGTFVDDVINRTTAPAVVPVAKNLIDAVIDDGIAAVFLTATQIVTDVLYKCPISLVSHASVAAQNPTWRYLFNATFPDTQSAYAFPAVPDVGAYHSSDIALVFGNYAIYSSAAPATAQEVALSKFMQTAWADFAKSPGDGPGWTSNAALLSPIGCLGCSDNPNGVTVIDGTVYDTNCKVYNNLYDADTAGS